ncbi:MAG: zinc ribbon domain-containing protein [Chloroflexi bacterium]|nr:zinc ribbon domain-containing protein [Chloroflexota bacterium]
MPVYEYRCPACTHLFEKLVPFAQAGREADCPICCARAGKVLSTFAAIGASSGSAGSGPVPVGGGGGGCRGGGCCGGS